ncbi:MAG: TetR/AcrR family transcriptional regulator [Gemmatimonadota bacterium]
MIDDTSATLSPRVLEKRARRRREILHAALEAVREQGWHATTLDDIAGRLGIQKTALYHYFPDKDSILYACHRESLAELDRIIEESEQCCEDPLERLTYIIREHVRVMTDTLEGSPLAFEVPSLPPERRAEVIAGRDRYEHTLRGIIARGTESGVFRKVDPKTSVFVILGAINWIARWYRPGGSTEPDELGRRFAEHLLGGLAA